MRTVDVFFSVRLNKLLYGRVAGDMRRLTFIWSVLNESWPQNHWHKHVIAATEKIACSERQHTTMSQRAVPLDTNIKKSLTSTHDSQRNIQLADVCNPTFSWACIMMHVSQYGTWAGHLVPSVQRDNLTRMIKLYRLSYYLWHLMHLTHNSQTTMIASGTAIIT